ncbi:MAG TPA: ATP-binding protein [Terriglobia bacterium]|nr:ATP-binding protein [Terriglobia bacterium]
MSLLKRPRSVRARLTLAYVAAMVAVLGVYAGVVYISVRSSMSTALDEKLRYDLSWPKDMIFKDSVRGLLNGEWMNDPVRIQESSGGPWLQVWSADGETLLFATPEARINLIPDAAHLAKTPDRKIRTLSDMVPPYRILTGKVQVPGAELVIQVAESELPMRNHVRNLLFILLLGLPLAVAFAGLGGYYLARRALAPVDRMAEQARLITAERLTERLPVDNPGDELGRLATVFNQTLMRLESSFEQMRRFTADASHELRTPLTAMKSVGEIGLRSKRDPAAYREVIGSMLEEVDRLSLLVDRLLTLSRADNGESMLSRDRVDLCELAEEVTTQLGVLAEEKQQGLTVDATGPSVSMGDRMVLRQALLNLVDNAIKYSPVGGRIVVKVSTNARGLAVLDVSDTGPGIPEDMRPRVFDRFYRADESRSRENGGGTGLGLSIARWAVEVNGGQLTLESTEGTGATFRITLPNTV